ncbi:hypothetical protein ACWT_2805 [Actinoplanes sp. SE50]|uniref:alpha/beta hydrolase n=1 Tax=unclassified Actinoplanes TaxID=2626549 RepID=UPI00023EC5DA|nr:MULTISPECIES: alpha/beta hydrolase [unclassified Actinoplanes]AEV83636.1 hypothetical protein ACPL_2741 [Actinoplanes sp. SE50/110]ATO82220.1 hypothetical protein ACWT_2805 [Actinoplanes sp. SE50]SLL99627.1 hypothetical protein ACSP50_2858 [Actinoplanes sp. SE50/110]
MTTVLLIHGGLGEDMNADRFWHRPGVVTALRRHGVDVVAPDRLRRPTDWTAEADHLTTLLPGHPVTVVAGSNGCSAAVRLALAAPGRVARLLLAWPATAGDPRVDHHDRRGLTDRGTDPAVIDSMLTGQTLRGVTDDELAAVTAPVGVLASIPANPFHQRRTVDALMVILPTAVELPGCPEPPHPAFPAHAGRFVHTVVEFGNLSGAARS